MNTKQPCEVCGDLTIYKPYCWDCYEDLEMEKCYTCNQCGEPTANPRRLCTECKQKCHGQWQRSKDPTPEEIEEAARKIREGWSEEKKEQAACGAMRTVPFQIPVTSFESANRFRRSKNTKGG